MAGQSESDIKSEEEYREYICRNIYKNKECGFQVRAKTEEAAMEHARMHEEQAHGMKETSPEMEKRIKENIKPVSMAGEQKEYTCSEPECDFSVRAQTEDEIIEQAHMHQELEHGVKESIPETRERIRGEIRTVRVPIT